MAAAFHLKSILYPLLIMATCLLSSVITNNEESTTNNRESRQFHRLPYPYLNYAAATSVNSNPEATRAVTFSNNPGCWDAPAYIGIFPALTGHSCPSCPAAPARQTNDTVTECGNELSTVLSSAPAGDISLSAAVPTGANEHATCYVGLSANYPDTKVSVKCNSVPTNVLFFVGDVTPVPDTTNGGARGTTYVSNKSYLVLKVYAKETQTAFSNFGCTWRSVP